MEKWNLVIDVAKCHDCNNCFLACKDEYFQNDFQPYSVAQPRHGHRWMDVMRNERGQYPKVDMGYLPYPCMHCDNAPCIKTTKNDAIYKRDDGIVIIDPEKAKGQKDLVASCPYGVIYWNDEKSLPQKCTLCVHLLEEGWNQPRCAQACPTGALSAVRTDDPGMEKMMKTENLEHYRPEFKTRPRVYYKNLYRYTKCFIAGSVALGDKDECAEEAEITLGRGPGKAIEKTVSNNYGDFKVDNLAENSGKYDLEVAYPGYKKQNLSVDLKTSINLGTIFLYP